MGEEIEQDQTQDQSDEAKAQEKQDEVEQAKEEMKELEQADELPDKLEDWPSGKAKYETFGGPEAESGYEDGATEKLGPSDLRHHEDGSVTIGGEEVDDPDEYKGEPIPGGPTDPDAPEDIGVTKTSIERQNDDDSSEAESGDSEDD
jgi:hypothetical protein